MVKSQKVSSKPGRTKQSGARPNLSYSTRNLSLDEITPLAPSPPLYLFQWPTPSKNKPASDGFSL